MPEVIGADVFERFNKRMPKSSDRLFKPIRDPMASLAQHPAERMYRLNLGYKFAGDVLVERAIRDQAERRNLLFPIIFCYRHYMEIAIKSLIEEHGERVDYRQKLDSHILSDLWAHFLKMVGLGGGFHTSRLNAMNLIIAEFSAIDPQSVVFRFPTSRKGETMHLPGDGVDLINLHDVMNGVENWFQCVDLALSHESWPYSSCELLRSSRRSSLGVNAGPK